MDTNQDENQTIIYWKDAKFRGALNVAPSRQMLESGGLLFSRKFSENGEVITRYIKYDKEYILYRLTKYMPSLVSISNDEFMGLMSNVWHYAKDPENECI
jgi:hypothetical protein